MGGVTVCGAVDDPPPPQLAVSKAKLDANKTKPFFIDMRLSQFYSFILLRNNYEACVSQTVAVLLNSRIRKHIITKCNQV